MAGLGFDPVLLGFALASLGYAIGLALRHSPMPEGRSWGASSLATASSRRCSWPSWARGRP